MGTPNISIGMAEYDVKTTFYISVTVTVHPSKFPLNESIHHQYIFQIFRLIQSLEWNFDGVKYSYHVPHNEKHALPLPKKYLMKTNIKKAMEKVKTRY